MANANISIVTLTNTFDEWRTRTNAVIDDRNQLRNYEYVKDNSNFIVANGSIRISRANAGTTLTNDNDALNGGELTTNTLVALFTTTIGGNTFLTNSSGYLWANNNVAARNVHSNVCVYASNVVANGWVTIEGLKRDPTQNNILNVNSTLYMTNSGAIFHNTTLLANGAITANLSTGNALIVSANTYMAGNTFIAQNSNTLNVIVRTKTITDTIENYIGGDTPINIRTTGTQNVAIGTNSTERLRVVSDGKVGIGTSQPDALLTLNGGTTEYAHLYGRSSSTVGSDLRISRSSSLSLVEQGPNIRLEDGTTNNNLSIQNGLGNLQIWNYSAGSWTERMRLDTNGNLGLGVTPSTWSAGNLGLQIGASSHVAGISALTTGSNYYYNSGSKYYSAAAATQYVQSGGAHLWNISSGTPSVGGAITFTQAMTLDTNGNLGIGITTPSTRLDFGATNPTRGIVQRLYNLGSSGQTGAQLLISQGGIADWVVGQPAATNALAIWSGRNTSQDGTERMRIDSSGNLGLGVTPDTKLHVYSSGTQTIKFTQASGATRVLLGNQDSSGANKPSMIVAANGILSYGYGSSWTSDGGTFAESMRLDASGNVGIGVVPSAFANNFKSIQINQCSIFSNGWNNINIASNVDGNVNAGGSGGNYGNANYATRYQQISGNHYWFNAPSGTAGSAITWTQAMTLDTNGNLGIGTGSNAIGYKLQVVGSFAATTKSFLIPHPTKEGRQLRYASLEGPENGVYVRGKLVGSNVVELPDYWTKLVDPDSITVNLTPIGAGQNLYVSDISNNTVTISNETGSEIKCFYTIYGERVDVEKLIVEV